MICPAHSSGLQQPSMGGGGGGVVARAHASSVSLRRGPLPGLLPGVPLSTAPPHPHGSLTQGTFGTRHQG